MNKTNSPALDAMLAIHRQYEDAAKRLAEATEKALPPGTVVAVTMGGVRIVGEVLKAGGSWWHHPSDVRIRNVRTGKERIFSATYEGHALKMLNSEEAKARA